MKAIATMALKDGMILAGDVYSFKGNLIAREWDRVDHTLISKLSRHSIMCVDIKEPEDLTVTDAERMRSSQDFRQFEAVYQKNLDAYKYMIQAFLNENTPLNTSYLLTLHHQILSCLKQATQELDFLYLLPRSEDAGDRSYTHMLTSSLICTIFGEWAGLSEKELKLFALCGLVYDIGMLRLQDPLLPFREELTPHEMKLLKTHTLLGYQMLLDENLNERIKLCTLYHHERCDGSGYPKGLKGDAIDPFSGLMAIVDDYERMSHAHRCGEEQLTPSLVIRNFEKEGLAKYDVHTLRLILKHLGNSIPEPFTS